MEPRRVIYYLAVLFLSMIPLCGCQDLVPWAGREIPSAEETPPAIISCDFTSEVMSSAETGE
jgi:hypothetical protein